MVSGTGEGPCEKPTAPRIGVLGIQGSFLLHLRALAALGVETQRVVKPADLDGLDGLILPGGESTVLSLLARKYDLVDPLRQLAADGVPLFGTCAGAILLGRGERPPRLGVAPVDVHRNAYGSQLESFTAPLKLAPFDAPFHGVFIRAPQLEVADGKDADVEILGWHGKDPVLVRSGNLLLATFHPELTDDDRLHRYFVDLCCQTRDARDAPRSVAARKPRQDSPTASR